MKLQKPRKYRQEIRSIFFFYLHYNLLPIFILYPTYIKGNLSSISSHSSRLITHIPQPMKALASSATSNITAPDDNRKVVVIFAGIVLFLFEGVIFKCKSSIFKNHKIIMIGPPGSGKTVLAKRLPTILPPLSLHEALETTKIYSVSGKLGPDGNLISKRPYRSPHHTISDVVFM